MTRTPVPFLLAGSILVLALAGCTPTGPGVVETPKVVTESDGTSALESDEFVVAARAADLGEAVAWNAADFSIEQISSTHTATLVASMYKSFDATYVLHGEAPTILPGPSVWLPLGVTPVGGGATVDVCDASKNWVITAGHETPTYDLAAGTKLTIDLVKDSSGAIVLAERRPSTEECDATGALVQRFDPVPTLPKSITAGDVRGPISK